MAIGGRFTVRLGFLFEGNDLFFGDHDRRVLGRRFFGFSIRSSRRFFIFLGSLLSPHLFILENLLPSGFLFLNLHAIRPNFRVFIIVLSFVVIPLILAIISTLSPFWVSTVVVPIATTMSTRREIPSGWPVGRISIPADCPVASRRSRSFSWRPFAMFPIAILVTIALTFSLSLPRPTAFPFAFAFSFAFSLAITFPVSFTFPLTVTISLSFPLTRRRSFQATLLDFNAVFVDELLLLTEQFLVTDRAVVDVG